MKLINYIKENYNFYILIGLTLAFHFVSAEAFLVGVVILSLFYICLDFIQNKHIPLNKKYIMIIPLLIYLILGTLLGLANHYEKHNILRDIFYHTNTLAVIILTLTMFTNKIKKEQVFWCILIVGTLLGLNTLYKILNLLKQGKKLDDYYLRHYIDNYGYEINFIAFFTFSFIKKYKYITIPLCLFNLLMAITSFSRVLFLLLFFVTFSMFLYYLIFSRYKIQVLSIVLILVIGLYFASFTTTYQEYVLRFSKSFNELNPNQDWSIDQNINDSWRGYEMWMIVNNFNSSSILNKIIGKGFGSFVYSESPITIELIVDGNLIYDCINEIAIFHNGYFGALFKCGIVGVILYTSFLISLYVYSFKYIKNKKDLFLNLALITYIVLASSVVMGLFHKEVWFVLVFLVIYLIKYHYDKRDDLENNEKEVVLNN